MSERVLPHLTDAERVAVEEKLLASGLAKVNSGQSPSRLEMQIIERAHARGKRASADIDTTAAAPSSFLPVATTELGFDVVVCERLEQRGLYDLTRIKERKPELVKATVKMLAKGVGVDEVAEMLSLDVRTIAAIRDDAETSGAMPGHKEMSVRRFKSLLGLMFDKIEDKVREGAFTVMDMAIVVDKIELLSGGVTSRTEVTITDDTGDFERLLKQARSKMVIDAEDVSAKGAPPPAQTPPLALDHAVSVVARDSQCTASSALSQDNDS